MPILVERKLIQLGNSLAVTLPKAWAKYFQLKAGDIVEIVADDILTVQAKPGVRNIYLCKDLTEK
jgi:antitoxin component of MazEF toxin-antitoxin module